jgi:hypothetical protein
LVHLIQQSDWVRPRGNSTQKLRISLAVSPLPYDKIAVEVLNLTTSRRSLCALRVGERHRLGFRGFASAGFGLSGDPSIANNPPPPSGALPSRGTAFVRGSTERKPGLHRLSAGGRWIRTISTPLDKPSSPATSSSALSHETGTNGSRARRSPLARPSVSQPACIIGRAMRSGE